MPKEAPEAYLIRVSSITPAPAWIARGVFLAPSKVFRPSSKLVSSQLQA
jgi:hypothetical protein